LFFQGCSWHDLGFLVFPLLSVTRRARALSFVTVSLLATLPAASCMDTAHNTHQRKGSLGLSRKSSVKI
jgi:hypothetical protein